MEYNITDEDVSRMPVMFELTRPDNRVIGRPVFQKTEYGVVIALKAGDTWYLSRRYNRDKRHNLFDTIEEAVEHRRSALEHEYEKCKAWMLRAADALDGFNRRYPPDSDYRQEDLNGQNDPKECQQAG